MTKVTIKNDNLAVTLTVWPTDAADLIKQSADWYFPVDDDLAKVTELTAGAQRLKYIPGSYTIKAEDFGLHLQVQAEATITLPIYLPVGFKCSVEQSGADTVTFAVADGGTLVNRQDFTITAGQYAVADLLVRANTGNAAEWLLTGDLAVDPGP